MRAAALARHIPAPLQLGLLAAALVLAIALPYLTSSFYVSVATQILFFGLLAMSIDLLGGYTGLMPLGHAGVLGISAYTMGYLVSRLRWGWVEAAGVALALTVLVSLLFGFLAVRTRGIFFVMITMAEGMLVWGLAYRWASVTGAENGIRGIARPAFATLYWQYYYFALVVFLLCALALWLLVRSPFGLTLRGIRESESRMRTLGYNVTLHKLLAFTISGFFAGVAGLLYAWYNQYISPSSVHISASTEGLLMVVLGGAGTLLGPVLGAAVIVAVKNLLSMYVARWPTVLGLIFIVVVLFAKDGLVGLGRRGWAAWQQRQQRPVSAAAPGAYPMAVDEERAATGS
ncbi:MAG TPA: branched-chain amino acid ABC transporter permease [Chloroflexota bacterium]|jgi:branched-chain amino acid transport system permease protein|nr:branched-chain amino acid ABC transporter permease [Chloroflexota bacterium]